VTMQLGKMLIYFGAIIIVIGVIVVLVGKVPGVGRLPGDILVKKGSFTFYFPLATCLIVSVILSFLLSFLMRR
jgi:hypothetical protein